MLKKRTLMRTGELTSQVGTAANKLDLHCACVHRALIVVHNWSRLVGQSEDFDTSIIDNSTIGCHISDPRVVRNEKKCSK